MENILCPLRVVNRLLHRTMGGSAIRMTQIADIQIGRGDASNRPIQDIERSHNKVIKCSVPRIQTSYYSRFLAMRLV